MEAVHLDTHVAIWFYAGELDFFPGRVRVILEKSALFISPFVLLEIQYLKEAGKVNINVDTFLREMSEEFGLEISSVPFSSVALEAINLSWTCDPFDRMIVAQAIVDDMRLLTRDKTILKHCHQAFWA